MTYHLLATLLTTSLLAFTILGAKADSTDLAAKIADLQDQLNKELAKEKDLQDQTDRQAKEAEKQQSKIDKLEAKAADLEAKLAKKKLKNDQKELNELVKLAKRDAKKVKNFADYDKIAKHVNDNQHGWNATADVEFDWDDEHIYNITNLNLDESSFDVLPPQSIRRMLQTTNSSIPENFTASDKWPQCSSLINEVQDQSFCGSCWAVATTTAVQDRICISSGGQKIVKVSYQDLLECCTSCGLGCRGGSTAASYNYWLNTGFVTGGTFNSGEGCKPHQFPSCSDPAYSLTPICLQRNSTTSCQASCTNSNYTVPYLQDKIKGKSAYRVFGGEPAIINELLTNGPVTVAITVYKDFMTYQSGIYKWTSGGLLGGHAIKLIGYGVENGVKYWLCVNSWGIKWGDKGFFKILRGVNHMQIETYVVAGIPY
jgi:cathepsin B